MSKINTTDLKLRLKPAFEFGKNVIEDDVIPKEYLLGKIYGVSWAKNRAMCWKLERIFNGEAYLRTVKTHRELVTKVNTLRLINPVEAKRNSINRLSNKTIPHKK